MHRSLAGIDGRLWRVREIRAHDVPGALANTCLIFDAGTVMRRFWTYPTLWATVTDAELLAFVERRR